MKFSPRLSACIPALLLLTSAGLAHAESTLRIGLGSDPDMLDPATARTYYGRFVFSAMCERLVDVDQHLQIVPGLAKDWAYSDDGKTLTMNLREGVTFHDGEKFDAAAVKFNIERYLTLPGSLRKSELSSVDSVEVTAPYTVVFHLKTADAALLMQLTDRAGTILAPEATAKGNVAAHPVCSGPYEFVSRVQQDRIVLKRFDNYWNKGAYHFDKVVFLPIPDASVRLANLRAGDLDITEGIAASDTATVKADSNLQLASTTGLGYMGLTLNIANGTTNTNTPLAKDARVRQALSLAIDRDALNQVVFQGQYTPANQAFSPASPYHADIPVPKRDIEKAKKLLAEAGVKTPLTIDFLVANNPTSQQVAQVLQAMVSEAGINLNLQMTEYATLLDRQQSGAFQMSMSGWSGRPDPDGNIFSFLSTKGGLNDGKYSNPKVDQWLQEARLTSDVAQRKALYKQVVEQENIDDPLVYLYFEPRIFGISKKVTGFVPYADGLIRLQGLALNK
ncbi:ABC transporter substrate-binding protein [Rahnella sp. AA]|uniref:ABC transporter substrate-binding protein n=1 Tax=Rahnella sp. AA TaxID=2057180 RepID=UPI000C323DDD|nr:ABC transporter substrate-binding protein [Rahnella sp. AA]PKE30861.1 ABC transporter substrate-binding protein [Rahnella sp. AA]